MGEIHVNLRREGKSGMPRHFHSLVPGDGLDQRRGDLAGGAGERIAHFVASAAFGQGDWLTSDPATLTHSLEKFVGGTAYTIDTLRTDLARFAFLLTGEEAVRLFGGDQQ
jgi:hypothetical protein